jgi:glycosyltransferase involved in cell wall biosynthesis
MLKVGLVTNEFYPVWGGVSTYCINLCRSLAGKVELHVFLLAKTDIDYSVLFNAYPSLKSVSIHVIGSATNNNLLSTLKFQVHSCIKLPRLIKELDLDIIHSATFLADGFLRWLGIKAPNILTVHSTVKSQIQGFLNSGRNIYEFDTSEVFTLMTYPILKTGELLSLKKSPNVISVSNSVGDELKKDLRYKGNLYIIHNGIDLNAFHPKKEHISTKHVVLFAGRIIALKGIETIIKAIPLVLKQYPQTLFIFAGAGRCDPYKKMLSRLDVPSPNYRFIKVPYGNMPGLYQQSDIFVLPSYMESCPMSILEASASGVPVIATNVGDIPNLVDDGKTGFLFSPGDWLTLASLLKLLLEDEGLCASLGTAGRKKIENDFSINMLGIKTLDVYKKILTDNYNIIEEENV